MNTLSIHEKYMQRCLQLAQMAEGHTYSNPLVGSVIVHEGRIIGEGYHRKAGEPHAEVNAVASVKDKSLLSGSTLYVNLEPCAHYGKTPPCSKLIIDNKIPHVVIGCIDDFSEVAGKGVEMMEKAGVKVEYGILEKESRELNRRFFTFHNKKRPYVILKWAQTLDGFLDIDRDSSLFGQPTWITNAWARRAVHKQRRTEQAILVGTYTALKDNPSLTVRDWVGPQPLRIVIDRKCQLTSEYHLMDNSCPTIVINSLKDDKGWLIEFIKADFDQNLPEQILQILWEKGIQSVIIEGGHATLDSFIMHNLWDEAHKYIGNTFFESGVKAPVVHGKIVEQSVFGDSRLFVYRNNIVF
ncbi:bifunctional diaminohydroxyphosphoribosylaminopyrimidine deaminase/5-amino-6-(5-phosphoribosylamino)uracil reductase RibD [Carboxylicivirga linearis]|uniref:Riboflavin biosynthesis protein RibD n=1 Tax=Carboxylicivirga linearis TaxID=1628157 RepID=A0ABS5JPU3_9BACT|nr:bifunctional diaminohydroxyphosphoribosylaminopyrimidine deaminase/5-amino-6-(5-phosphoribosylamino)uracil reductase RibD [Carboxylicivirga linearis]MBS2096906.1 bifunctional diaminohydroxyphosphoribosylaminopyrimidine deaminase/5-amino-6-(5-phosphoribosylamino)uracil reductase RibD [Carboxylicivirga linearis]